MDRRSFVKLVAAGFAGAAVPLPVGAWLPRGGVPGFDPASSYGNFVVLTEDPAQISSEHLGFCVDTLVENARQVLPRGTEFKIGQSVGVAGDPGDPYAEDYTLWWKYSPKPHRDGHLCVMA